MATFRGEKAAGPLAMKHTFDKGPFAKPHGDGLMRRGRREFLPFFQIKSEAYDRRAAAYL